MVIEIERREHPAGKLRRLACRVLDPAQAQRTLAIALEGLKPDDVGH